MIVILVAMLLYVAAQFAAAGKAFSAAFPAVTYKQGVLIGVGEHLSVRVRLRHFPGHPIMPGVLQLEAPNPTFLTGTICGQVDAFLVTLEGCGHLPQEECPDRFVDAVAEWLATAAPR